MATSKTWRDWAVSLDANTAQAGTAVLVNGITSASVNPNLSTALQGGDGEPYNSMGYLASGAPTASFTTSDLAVLLGECGTTGMLIDSGDDGEGVALYFQRTAQGGTRAALASELHQKVLIANGIMTLGSLNLPHRGRGTISVNINATSSNGVLSPLTFTETSTLPSATYPVVDNEWTLGKVDLNGTAFSGVQNVTVNFGASVVTPSGDGDIYPSLTYIGMIQPSITITSNQIDITATTTENGYYLASGMVLYARHRAEGGTYVADGTATHIKLTMGKCRIDTGAISGNPEKGITTTITPWNTPGGSAVNPITLALTSAIT